MPGRKLFVSGLSFAVAVVLRVQAQATFTDSFATPVNYLTNGVARTIWNGIYFGAGEFANTGLASTSTGVTVAGSTSDCDADISANSVLTVTSAGTGWEGTEDDGFFLFKEIAGDFSVRVHIVTPFDNGQYNTAGLQVRAAGPNGNPYGGAENFVSWTRFNEFGFGNYLRNEVNGTVTEINPNPGSGPGQGVNDTNYWLRIDRVGNTFNYYSAEYGPISNDWVQVPPGTAAGAASRPDWAGLPLQVGIMHATFEGTPATHTAHFEQFSLSASNLTMTAAPAPVTDLTLTTNEDGSLTLSWIPGAGSTGSLVVAWTGTNSVVKEVPADGITYSGNSAYGQGDTLPATNYYVVYSGPGNSMTLSNLAAGTIYNVAVFSYAGSGSSLTYNHTPATALATPSLRIQARLQGMDVLVTANADPGKWYWLQYSDSLNPPDWTYVGPVAPLDTYPTMMLVHSNGASASQRFYRLLQFDSLPAGRNLAPFAAPMTSYVSPWETLSAIDDGYMPTNSADHSHGAYGNYPQTGTQWVEYDWPLPITTSRMDVYWWQDNVGIYAPASCSLQYWNGNGFVPVSNPSGLGVALDQFNTTTFDPVTTTRLRLLFQSDASGHSTGILEWRVYDAGGSLATWPAPPTNSEFLVKLGAGAIESLQRAGDSFPTEYVATSERLGDAIIKYEPSGGNNWNVVQTADSTGVASTSYSTSPDGTEYMTTYLITNSLSGSLILQTIFTFQQDAVHWTLNFTNLTSQPLMIGDLALPLPMNTSFSGVSSSVLKHSFISGYDSYLFWMRPNSVGPELLMTPDDNTKLEYWDTLGPGSETFFLETLGGFEAYIHSYVASTNAAAQYPSVITQGDRWRQPNTSLTLAPGASQTYGFKFQWADGYDDIRQKLVDDGKVDVHIVPGMTVPTNLFAEIALNTTQTVSSVDAEFPAQTQIQFLGTTNVGAGNYQLYQVQFSRLGENELTIHYGNSRTMYLEFFATEPVETLIKKRAAFIASHQVIDTNKWYNGLLCEWNMNDEVMLTPDNYDTLSGFVVYEVASDDPGESRPAYLATKEAVFPVQSEVSALDDYITNFVWGGLQRTTNETDSYGNEAKPQNVPSQRRASFSAASQEP